MASEASMIPIASRVSKEESPFYRDFNGRVINIFGVTYTIVVVPETDPRLTANDANGLCEVYSKELIVRDFTAVADPKQYTNIYGFCQKILRHEIIHAIFFESGHAEWFEDETIVDALSYMLPQMIGILEEVGVAQLKIVPEGDLYEFSKENQKADK